MVESAVSRRPSARSSAPVASASLAHRLRAVPQRLRQPQFHRDMDRRRNAVRLDQVEKLECREL